jgi:tetraacyldisaccharide 4'-kinase
MPAVVTWERTWYGPFDAASRARSWALWPLSLLYGLGTRCWHLAFDLGLRQPVRVAGARVISIGNLVVGGAGKTPLTIALATAACEKGLRVAVLTRGHGRTGTAPLHFDASALPDVSLCGDEARLIARSCPGVTVWVDGDRVRSARQAVAAGASLLLLDDGFQHRRLARDVDLLVDAGQGNGRLLPSGPLREPASARARATAIIGRDGVPGDLQVELTTTTLEAPDGTRTELRALNRPVVVLLGLARPGRVLDGLARAGVTVAAAHLFPDHHCFTEAERGAAEADAARLGAVLVTTAKDAERLPGGVHVLRQTLAFTHGAERLDQLLAP